MRNYVVFRFKGDFYQWKVKILTLNSNPKYTFSCWIFCGTHSSRIFKTWKIRNVPPVVHATISGRLQCTTGGTCTPVKNWGRKVGWLISDERGRVHGHFADGQFADGQFTDRQFADRTVRRQDCSPTRWFADNKNTNARKCRIKI